MTAKSNRLLPLAALAALLAGVALAFAVTGGVAADGERDQTLSAEDIAPGGCQDGRCGPGTAAECPAEVPHCGDTTRPPDTAATCVEGTEDCQDTVDSVAPDIAQVCVEGAEDCVDTVAPGEPIADCAADIYPCYDTGVSPPGDAVGDRCKQLADDLVACIAGDPDAPVPSDPFPQDVPAAPPDGAASEPSTGSGSAPGDPQLAEDIAAREECIQSGQC